MNYYTSGLLIGPMLALAAFTGAAFGAWKKDVFAGVFMFFAVCVIYPFLWDVSQALLKLAGFPTR